MITVGIKPLKLIILILVAQAKRKILGHYSDDPHMKKFNLFKGNFASSIRNLSDPKASYYDSTKAKTSTPSPANV